MTKTLVLVPFVCPICTAPNAVHLIKVAQAGGTACVACKKWLTSQDLMRARVSPRPAGAPASSAPPTRA